MIKWHSNFLLHTKSLMNITTQINIHEPFYHPISIFYRERDNGIEGNGNKNDSDWTISSSPLIMNQ